MKLVALAFASLFLSATDSGSSSIGKIQCPHSLEETYNFLLSKNVSLASVNDVENIETIDFSGVGGLSDDELPYLCQLTGLKQLQAYNDHDDTDNSRNVALTGKNFEYLSNMNELEHIDFDGNALHFESLGKLSSLGSLQTLRLYKNPLSKGGLGIRGVSSLLKLKNLKSIVLQGSESFSDFLTDDDVAEFSRLSKHPSLSHIDLSSNKIEGSQEAISALASIEKLNSLSLCGVGLKDTTDLSPLVRSRVQTLSVGNSSYFCAYKNKITSENISTLIGATSLKNLDLNGLSLDQASLVALAQLPHLEKINMKPTKTDVAGLREFIKNMPKLKCLRLQGRIRQNEPEAFDLLNQEYEHIEFKLGSLFNETCF